MNRIIKNNLRILLFIWSVSFFSTAYAQDNLTVKWGDKSGFTDISTLPTLNVDWDLSVGTQQLQITANFANFGTPGERKIVVRIPRGFKIQVYSAKKGTPAISGVSQIGLSDEDEAKLNSSTVIALDSISSFASQRITGYTGAGANTNTPYYNMDGLVVYDCTSQCDNIILTLTLALDPTLLPYHVTTTAFTLPENIKVSMSNATSAANFSKELTVTATGMPVISALNPTASVMNSGASRQVEGVVDVSNPNKGTVPTFITGFGYGSNAMKPHFAETIVFQTTYLDGVVFQGFDVGTPSNVWWMEQHPTDFMDGLGGTKTYANGHLTVTVDLEAHTVTYTFKNVRSAYTVGISPIIRAYWTATVDGTSIRWTTTGSNYPLVFSTTITETGGGLIGSSQTTAPASPIKLNIYLAKPQVKINLTPLNRTTRDLNAYANTKTGADYPYNQSIGTFGAVNTGPSTPVNITYTFDFPDNPKIQGVTIPAVTTEDAAIDATGTTNTNRTVKYKGTPAIAANNAVRLTPQMFGLTSGEYLTHLEVKQNTLTVTTFNSGYTTSAICYYGKFVNGQTGSVKLTITDANGGTIATATDSPKPGWNDSGGGSLNTTVQTPAGNPANTFYPGQAIKFTSTYTAGTVSTNDSPDTVDPDIYINLPAGIELDVNSVSAQSPAGKKGSARFSLTLAETATKTINGSDWTSYRFQVTNPLDIIAVATNLADYPSGGTAFNVTYTANVSSACNAYASLPPSQIYQIDLGQTAKTGLAPSNGNFIIADDANLTGKGTSYNLVGAVTSPNLSVVQKPGLQVYLGIKTAGTSQNYYTYNGNSTTVAAVSRDVPAEIWLKYENTSNGNYNAGSEIYLPIPNKSIAYDHYFNNTNIAEPATVEDGKTANKAPQWTSKLITEASMPGFDTYYGIDTSPTTNYTNSNIYASWVPITMTWYPYSSLPAGKSLADVTMLKFVANDAIAPAGETGSVGETTFQLSVAPDALLGQYDYWRSYQKGWLDGAGAGTWVYGSVLAASPAMSGVEGLFFKDSNVNGVLDTGEKFSADMPAGFTASLMGPGISTPLMMKINTNGSFKSLNSDNSTFYLSAGTYTITINNVRADLNHFTTFYPDLRSSFDASNNAVWMNDIPLSGIRTDNASATFTFTVTPLTTVTQLVGIGLKDVPKYIMINPKVGGRVIFSK